jgi:hypothetical protein
LCILTTHFIHVCCMDFREREKKPTIFLYSIKCLDFIIETECVYCAVRTESLSVIRPRFVRKALMTSAKTFYITFLFLKNVTELKRQWFGYF